MDSPLDLIHMMMGGYPGFRQSPNYNNYNSNRSPYDIDRF